MTPVIASLVYDSWVHKVPKLRSARAPDRHLVFQGNGLILDLLMRIQGNDTCIHIGGQILPGDGPLNTVSDVEVSIKQGTRLLCTRTNALGEFAFHGVPNAVLDLALIWKGHKFTVRGLSNVEPRDWQIVADPLTKD